MQRPKEPSYLKLPKLQSKFYISGNTQAFAGSYMF